MKHLGIFILLITILLSSCGENRKNIASYYFPVDDLLTGRVYEYRMKERSMADSFAMPWYKYYLSVENSDGTFLINNNYSPTFFNDQYVMNRIVENGVLLEQYHMMVLDTVTQKTEITKINIERNNAFPFLVKENGGVTSTEINYMNPENKTEKIKFVRERKYVKDTTYTFNGTSIPAVIFEANEIRDLKDPIQGDYNDVSFTTEIYAKGIGLVEKRFTIGAIQMQSVLHDTFSMKQLEQMASMYWGKDVNLDN